MTNSRAALEEAARQKRYKLVDLARATIQRKVAGLANAAMFDDEQLADFAEDYAEQESSSLKLLFSAICKGRAEVFIDTLIIFDDTLLIDAAGQFPVELDSSGIPVLTTEILEALEATK